MKISRIAFAGFKGRTADITINPPQRMILTGPVGAGKSTVHEAMRLVLGLPTRFGSTNLHQFSPRGAWSAEVTIEGVTYQRALTAKGSTYAINGLPVTATNFETAKVEALGEMPGEVDLTEFLMLSGQKRAELFTRLLAGSTYSLAEAITEAVGGDLGTFAKVIAGPDAPEITVSNLPTAPMTPSEMYDFVANAVKDANRDERDKKSHYEQLFEQTVPDAPPENVQTLRDAVEAKTSRRGEIKATLEAAEAEAKRYRSAKAMLKQQDDSIAEKDRTLEAAKAKLPALQQAITEAAERQAAAETELESISREMVSIADEGKARKAELDAIPTGAEDDPAGELLKRRASWPKPTMTGMIRELVDIRSRAEEERENSPHNSVSWGMYDGTVDTARKVVEVLDEHLLEDIAAWLQVISDAVKDRAAETAERRDQAQRRYDEARQKYTAVQKRRDDEWAKMTAAQDELRPLRQDLEAAQKAIAGMPAELERLRQARDQMASELQQLGSTADTEALGVEDEGIQTEINGLKARITAAESAVAIKGQREGARVAMLNAQIRAKVLKELLVRLQAWRDRKLHDAMSQVLDPFRERLAAVLGADSGVQVVMSGTGRGTTMGFTINRGGFDVPLDTLSAGETALVAAAFLSAMQKIRGVQTRIMTMDAEALDGPSLDRLLAVVPSLGFHLAIVASNRLESPPAGWQHIACSRGGYTEVTA